MKKKTGLEKYEVDKEEGEFIEEVGIPKLLVASAVVIGVLILIFTILTWNKEFPECPPIPECTLECPAFNVSCPACPECPEVNQECVCPDIVWPNLSVPNYSCPDCNCVCDPEVNISFNCTP